MRVVEVWTGRHAAALRTALRLTNEAFAKTLGTATRTVAKWNAEPELVPVSELQRALDTVLDRAGQDAKERFSLILDAHPAAANDAQTSALSREEASAADLRLSHDPTLDHIFVWLDEHANLLPGRSRQRVASQLKTMNVQELQARAHRRGRITREEVANGLSRYYTPNLADHMTYCVTSGGRSIPTSILTHPDWLELALPLGKGLDRFKLDWQALSVKADLDVTGTESAVDRLAEVLAANARIINSPLYRLTDLTISSQELTGTVALTDFYSYALTLDLLENELIDALSSRQRIRQGSLPLRDQYLPDLDTVTAPNSRLCAGGPLALFAAARSATRNRNRADYVLLVQERSGHVLNAAHRLAVIPKAFHEPLNDFSDDAQLSATLEREMEEELFGRVEVDSTQGNRQVADPLHLTRLSAPMRWLMDHADEGSWRMECTAFGYNLVSGNFEFACLIVIDDETWWTQFGGHVTANWESSGLRRYSSLDEAALSHLVHDDAWSNEGLFAFLEGLQRLKAIGGARVSLPPIELEHHG
jgi:hypothetical protein